MKRWPVVRHIRWLYHRIQLNRWQAIWHSLGYFVVHDHDERGLQDIWDGKR